MENFSVLYNKKMKLKLMRKFYIFILAVLVALAVIVFLFFSKRESFQNEIVLDNVSQDIVSSARKVDEEKVEDVMEVPVEKQSEKYLKKPNEIKKEIKLTVPFVLQAPFANWSDPVFQNACEEAAIVMVENWLRGIVKISQEEAQEQIREIVKFENENFGYNADTDVFRIREIFEKYFDRKNINVREDISIEDIKKELQKGNLVLVPAFGRALQNPNYTALGPITHMLVIIGYDPVKKEFITNDSGTRKGANYRYSEKILFEAIWTYPSGKNHPEIPGSERKKSAIIVNK